jgi:hypothetical protein
MSKQLATENYLDKIPTHNVSLNWTSNEKGEITLEVENTGFANKLAQLILKKPKISFIHLDEMGNFIWPLIDGETNVYNLGKLVKEHFGDKSEPLYERLAQYLQTLESYGLINWK